MSKQPGCKAVYCGGQMYCTECGVTWDLDDEPAECKPKVNRATRLMLENSTYGAPGKQVGTDTLIKIKENLNRD